MRKIIATGLAVMAIAACSSVDCPVKNAVYTVYDLKKKDGTADTLGTDTLWVWTPRANGSDTDTLLNRFSGPKATTFSLPISHTLPEDTICLILKDKESNYYWDTIFIKKENYPHFESVDCQATYFHTITDVRSTHEAIDSIGIHHAEVNYDASTAHFHLFLKADR